MGKKLTGLDLEVQRDQRKDEALHVGGEMIRLAI
jgi:hypothetical protein